MLKDQILAFRDHTPFIPTQVISLGYQYVTPTGRRVGRYQLTRSDYIQSFLEYPFDSTTALSVRALVSRS